MPEGSTYIWNPKHRRTFARRETEQTVVAEGREGVGRTQQMQTTAFRIWSDSEVLPYVQHRELHPLRKRMLAHARPGHFAAQKLTEPRKPTMLKTL